MGAASRIESKVKDVNDLDKHPDGQRIFADLSAKWGLPAG
jgi:hypothetical protein